MRIQNPSYFEFSNTIFKTWILFELGIQNAGDFHFLSFETVHQIGPIEPEDSLCRKTTR